jgi:hypothetical protein
VWGIALGVGPIRRSVAQKGWIQAGQTTACDRSAKSGIENQIAHEPA